MPSTVTTSSTQQPFMVLTVEHWLDITSGSCLYLELQQQNTNVETLISQQHRSTSLSEQGRRRDFGNGRYCETISGKDTRINFSLGV